MQRLVYISSARLDLTPRDLNEILEEAGAFNSKHWITGLLLFNGLNFLQLLEGTEGVIASLYARIARDPRHHAVVTILKEPASRRIFPDWSMQLKQRPASASLQNVMVDDFSDVQARDMPDHIRRIFMNFDTLKS